MALDAENLNTYLKNLRSPHIYRDFTILIGGSLFLLSIYFFYTDAVKSSLETLEVFRFTWEVDIIVLVLSFAVGKLLLDLWSYVFDVYCFIVTFCSEFIFYKRPIKTSYISFKNLYLPKLDNLIFSNRQKYLSSLRELESKITIADIESVLDKFPRLASMSEREVSHLIFSKIISMILFLGIFFLSWKFLIPFIIIFLTSVSETNDLEIKRIEIAEAAVKIQGQRSKVI